MREFVLGLAIALGAVLAAELPQEEMPVVLYRAP
jgi:hypothetical protein